MKKTYGWNAVAVYIPHVFLELLQLRNMCYKAVLFKHSFTVQPKRFIGSTQHLNNILQVGEE